MGKRLGQHFLASGSVVARIVKAADPRPGPAYRKPLGSLALGGGASLVALLP